MKQALILSLAFWISAQASAADPPRNAPASSPSAARQPLDLRVGKVRKYMMPNEYRAAILAPDADKSTVVVEGNRPPPELRSLRATPMGLGAVIWGFVHPQSAWRIFVPDVNAPRAGPVVSKVPPPELRWGP